MVKLTKLKRIEKAKVKLKARKLPKGHNVTDTSFKAKKIILPGQLKTPNEQEIHTRKNLNVQELLSHLRHYRPSMRREGVSGLTELLTVYQTEVIKLHLPRVIDGVASQVLDIENDIRKSAIKLIETILTKISSEEIEPHFHTLQTYLSCAMTHITASIREDSLLLLDCLLNNCPHLMVSKADDILPHFLNMVSNSKYNSDHGRSLSLHLNNKIVGVKWRMSVFERLAKYFSAIVSLKTQGSQIPMKMDVDDLESGQRTVNWSETSPLYIAEFISFKREVCNLPRVISNTTVSTKLTGDNTASHERSLKESVMSLMPVLFEAWVEVAPERGSSEVSTLSEEAAVMLQYVTETLQHIWDCFKSWEQENRSSHMTPWLVKHYWKTITTSFLPGFPFSLRDNVFKPKGKQYKAGPIFKQEKSLIKHMNSLSPKCTHQNLSLSYLFLNMHDGKDETVVKPVIEFLQSCIVKWEEMEFFPVLEKVLGLLIIDCKDAWPRKEIVIQTFIKMCLDRSSSTKFREQSFSLLGDLVLQPEYHKELRSEEFDKWVSELPYVLFQSEVPVKTIKVLQSLASQNHEIFMINFKKRANAIANSLCEFPITGNSTPFEGQKIILNMLFYVMDTTTLDLVMKTVRGSEKFQELASYIEKLKEFHKFMNLL